jgi:PadR family transcriptional regulator PadR
MGGLVRITNPLLDVLEVLLQAFDSRTADLHGWAIMKATKRSGPTVYGVLDRLEDIGWISGRWEDENPEPGKPRRLQARGRFSASAVLTRSVPGAGRPERHCLAGTMSCRAAVSRDRRNSARHRDRAAR